MGIIPFNKVGYKVELVAQDQTRSTEEKKKKKGKRRNHDQNSFTGQNKPPTQKRVLPARASG